MTQKILVVEDDVSLGKQIVEHLEGAGYEPTWLKDGDSAMREPTRPSASWWSDDSLAAAESRAG